MSKLHSPLHKKKPIDLRSRNKKAEDAKKTLHAVEAVKMVTLLSLRNQGWGRKRLLAYNEQWNEILVNVSNGWLTLEDIADTIFDETGISLSELRLK